MSNYIAVVHKDSSSDYGISFSDFPGCIIGGKSIDTVKDLSNDALRQKLEQKLGQKSITFSRK